MKRGKPKQRYHKEDRDWRLAVLERDDFTCRRCGWFGKDVQAHHIAPRGRRPDLKHDLENGAAICPPCHTWIHSHPKEATEQGLLSDSSYELAKKEAA